MSSELSKEECTLKIAQVRKPALPVLVVDRDSMSSHLLADALVRDLRCDAAAISSFDLLRVLGTKETGLVVIGGDLNGRSGSGLDLASAVSHAHPQIGIVILLKETTREAVVRAFRAGARGVFCRQHTMPEFLDCVERVSKGFIWTGRDESSYLLEALRNIPAPRVSTDSSSMPLTARELQVVQCAAKGQSNKSIANELCLSEHTVKNYLFRAFDKLGVSNRIELLFYLTMKGHPPGPAAANRVVETPVSCG